MKTTIEEWGEALEAKDPGTWSHCKRVAAFATVLARALKLDEEEVRAIACGALVHEVGKLEIPEAILRKPTVLAAEEKLAMREYCVRAMRSCGKRRLSRERRRLCTPTASGSTEPAVPKV